MPILKFQGKVETGDEYRTYYEQAGDSEWFNGAIRIAGRDVIREVGDTPFRGTVTAAIADERFTGHLYSDEGWGYSEYTPMDPDTLQVGDHDLIKILKRHEGKEITLWISDEPVNLLDSE